MKAVSGFIFGGWLLSVILLYAIGESTNDIADIVLFIGLGIAGLVGLIILVIRLIIK